MTAAQKPRTGSTDQFGIERTEVKEPGAIDKLRDKWEWFDHLMRMTERYNSNGGNQYAAGITYFSVLAIFPLLMMLFAVLGYVLVLHPDLLERIQDQIVASVDETLGKVLNDIMDAAIAQRGAVASIGTLTALWTGLGWMNNLRFGVSKMWRIDPTEGNFIIKKLRDLIGLIGLFIALIVAFGVTALGSSGLTKQIIRFLELGDVPGIWLIVPAVSIAIGLLANFLVMVWLIIYLPRTSIPKKSGIWAAIIGAIALEIVKQLSSLVVSSAFKNPAGAVFGPIIALMVMLYLMWRILLYCSAWAATTKESLAKVSIPTPAPAVIRVRNEIRNPAAVDTGIAVATGAAIGAAAATLLNLFRRR
ncbi:inner membrane protein YhjD [Corynebacterium caspium]|uniref:inner membrane protein YhjD n=1 Tax=Corynebacterium caspium TaxID=234828 RepID=UPI000364401B|nr:inner membrane protein YhjD [Corynebacterium caspium]WKD59759.1 Inner membrane protein YhjD [Corynebacterium caspium DSM 44850]